MAWESSNVTLECGCAGSGSFDETEPGDAQTCGTHGATTVKRVSRIYESSGSRDFRFDAPVGAMPASEGVDVSDVA